MKLYIVMLLSILFYSCKLKQSQNINDIINSKRSSNTHVYQVNEVDNYYNFKNDSLFDKNSNKPFSGSIEIIGDLNYTKDDGTLVEIQTTLAFFKFKDGAFEGNQLYSVGKKKNTLFIYSPIIYNLDMQEDIDFKEVEDNVYSDFSIKGFGTTKRYQYINRKDFDPIKITAFWPNGNKIYEALYEFNYVQYAYGNFPLSGYNKELLIDNNQNVEIYHYNQKLAYTGKVKNGRMISDGLYFDFKGVKTDSSFFEMPRGVGLKASKVKEIELNIDDDVYKFYRKYFR